MRRALGWACIFLVGCAVCVHVRAQSTPPALQSWQDWVLHGHAERACPLLTVPGGGAADRPCVWPGTLRLDAGNTGGSFRLQVRVDAESWVTLPGSREAWPHNLKLDGSPAAVFERAGVPALRLPAGNHVVEGTFDWAERPARLRLPAAIALVELTVGGAAIAQPEREGDWITLGSAAARQRQADALDLRVFRRLTDGTPPMLATVLRLRVAGSAREQILGPALPPGFVATALEGELPARLDADGRLRVQLRPGTWTLHLAARGTAPLGKVAPAAAPPPWPRQEIWSYADAPALRTTRASGPPAIDPGQAEVPADWRNLPAFVMAPGAVLEVQQRARGTGADAARLHLQRGLWLDFDGHGLTAVDHLYGTPGTGDRLDVAAPWTLAGADADGAPLLVTRGGRAGTTGVELRTRALDLRARLRRAGHAGAQSATGGWQHTLDGVDATLHLPPGYRLLGAPGADRSPDSWIARWNLLDLFVAALIALLAGRLLGWPWALVALAFVVLSHGEPGAPRWTPALAIVLALVARVLPAGRLRGSAHLAGYAMLALAVIASLPFAAVEVRDALHPQLKATGLGWIAPARTEIQRPAAVEFLPPDAAKRTVRAATDRGQAAMSTAAAPPPPAPPPPPPGVAAPGAQAAADGIGASGYPAGSVLQTGPGTPAWADFGSAYRLGWSGPVTAQQTWRLVLLPAWATRILRLVVLVLLGAWLAAIARAFGLRVRWPGRRAVAGAAGVLLLTTLMPQAHAQSTPAPELLSQLQQRLLEAPRCLPDCVFVPAAQVAVRPGAVEVTLDANAAARVAMPLPQLASPAALRSATLDGRPAVGLLRRDGKVWMALDRGVHRLVLDFATGDAAQALALRFPLPPPVIQVAAPGWQATGIDGSRLLSDTLTLTRAAGPGGSAAPDAPAQAFAPYVTLTRSIAIGLDSRVDNVVRRVSPAEGGFTVDLPLLPGEHVTDPGLRVERGRVQVIFGPGQNRAQWSSTLDARDALALTAPALGARAETWRIASAPMLHLGFAGIPESVGSGATHVFRPLPGETLKVRVTRPAPEAGGSLAFDRVTLTTAAGARALDSTLTLAARSTRGGEHAIALPRDAVLLGAQRNGEDVELNARDGRVALPLQPGSQDFTLQMRQAATLGMRVRVPAVALDAPAANLTTSLELPQDRWILWTWGPTVGPAVLYWAQLIVLLIVAVALARTAPTPLRWWHWLLLGLGFSTFAWTAFVLVAAWLIALGLRARSRRVPALRPIAFNGVQVALALLTVAALASLLLAVPHGLLGQPDMRIAGAGSSGRALRWFADRTANALPRAGAFSLPLWCYKAAMLAWALWLASALIGWLRWGFHAWTGGGYWKPAARRPRAMPATAPGPGDARP